MCYAADPRCSIFSFHISQWTSAPCDDLLIGLRSSHQPPHTPLWCVVSGRWADLSYHGIGTQTRLTYFQPSYLTIDIWNTTAYQLDMIRKAKDNFLGPDTYKCRLTRLSTLPSAAATVINFWVGHPPLLAWMVPDSILLCRRTRSCSYHSKLPPNILLIKWIVCVLILILERYWFCILPIDGSRLQRPTSARLHLQLKAESVRCTSVSLIHRLRWNWHVTLQGLMDQMGLTVPVA